MEWLLVMLLLSTTIEARLRMTEEQCRQAGVKKINNFYYMKDTSVNITGIPADFSFHWKSGRLFFTLISYDYMNMRIQVLKNNRVSTITIDAIGQSTTIDNNNDIAYIATDKGIYKYDLEYGAVNHYAAAGDDVMYVAVANNGRTMYIATWPQNRVQIITKNGEQEETFPLIPNGHDLTIDTNNNLYFVAAKTSYILQADNTLPIRIRGLPNNKMTGIFVSRSNQVYGMDEASNMYLIDPIKTSATRLGTFDIDGVNAFAMDSSDNVLIGVKGVIHKFNKMEKSPCTVLMTLGDDTLV